MTPLSVRFRKAAPHLAAAALLALLGAVAYCNTLEVSFFLDDIPQIERNEALRITSLSPGQLWRASVDNVVGGRPLAYLTFALNYYYSGEGLAGFHVVNIAIHVLAGLAAYWLAVLTVDRWRRTESTPLAWLDDRGSQRLAFFAAAIFVLHPIQIQSVTYVVQRMNSMAALFYLLAMSLYVTGRLANRAKPRWTFWTLALASWVLSLLCKQNSVTLPVAILLYEWYFFRGLSVGWMPSGWKRWALLVSIVVLVGSTIAAVTLAQLSIIGDVFHRYQERDFTMGERLLTQPRVLCIYASLAAFPWPSRFNLLHYVETSRNLFAPPLTIVAIALLCGYAWLAGWTAKRNRLISFCLVWPLVHLAVESSILPLEMIFEHRMYLPMFGVSLLASTLLFRVLSGRYRMARGPVSVLLLVSLGVATYVRNADWADPITFWSDVIAKNPYEPRAYINRGGAYAEVPDWTKAAADYDRAIKLDETLDYAWLARGSARAMAGDHRRAISDYSAAMALATLNENRASARRKRGAAWAAEGFPHRAIADYSLAIQLEPSGGGAYFNRANAHRSLKNYRDAIADYKRCVQLQPNDPGGHNNLAAILLTCPDVSLREPKVGLEHAIRAAQETKWRNWQMLDTLAAAYAMNGDLSRAIQWQNRAIELAPSEHQNALRRQLDQFQEAAAKSPANP